MTKELFGGLLAPMTSEVGFLECSLQVASDYLKSWSGRLQASRGGGLDIQDILSTRLDLALNRLLPLTSVERRRTLLLTTSSRWCAYFDNGWRGADAYSTVSHMAEAIGCRGVRASYVPHELDQESGVGKGRYGSVVFEIYGPEKTDFVNTVRSVAVVYDGKKWVFSESGVVQDFEQPEIYLQRSVRSRFTVEMLQGYLASLGINAFDDGFYGVDGGLLFEKTGPVAPNLKEYGLAEARRDF